MKNKSNPINVVRVNPLETTSDNYLFQVISLLHICTRLGWGQCCMCKKLPSSLSLGCSAEGMLSNLSYLSLYDIMTHSHFDTWHHNKISKARQASNMTRDSKSVNLTHFQRLSICNLFSWNTSHSHGNLRRVSKSPLLHPFTHRRSGTLDWHVTKATSADSSRLIHTILAHSSTSLSFNLLSP
jgi:hypothetical protein